MSEREQFEAWADDYGLRAETYYSKHTEFDCFAAWKAATQRQQERIAELEAQVKALSLETERAARNRDMWKGQMRRQADRLHDLHSCMAAIKRLLARDPCSHANTAIQMIDAAIAAGKGEV